MIETSELLGCLTIVSIGVFVLLPVIELFVVIIKTATFITTDISNYIIATYKKPQELELQLKLAVQRHNHLTDNLIKQSIEIRDLNTEKLELSDEKLGLISETKVLHEKNFELIIERNGLERILEDAEERENGLKHEIRGLKDEIGGLEGRVKLLENNLMEIDFELDDLLEERDGWGVSDSGKGNSSKHYSASNFKSTRIEIRNESENEPKPMFCIGMGIDEELQNDDITSVSELDSIQAGSPIFITQPRDIEAYCYEADIDSDMQYDSDTVIYE